MIFEKARVTNLDKLRPAQIRAAIVEQLAADRWTAEGHIFSCVLNTPGVIPTGGATAKLRAALRYLLRQGKVNQATDSDGAVHWRLVG
jgi:alanine dehydrogenase